MENGKQPCQPTEYDKHGINGAGLTKREYFAAKIYSKSTFTTMDKAEIDQAAIAAVKQADALLKALEG